MTTAIRDENSLIALRFALRRGISYHGHLRPSVRLAMAELPPTPRAFLSGDGDYERCIVTRCTAAGTAGFT